DNLTVDFGFVATLSLGNRLWFDTGAGAAYDNGVFDEGETPVANALVELLDDEGAVVASQRTDAAGYYRFDGLAPGTYQVRVAGSNFDPAVDPVDAPLVGHLSSTPSSGAFDTVSNNQDKGVNAADPVTTGVLSAPVVLDPLTTALPTGE